MKSIITKYLPPTNVRGSRIKASDMDGNSVTIHRECGWPLSECHDMAVRKLCKKMGWTGTLHIGDTKGGYVYVWKSGENIKIR